MGGGLVGALLAAVFGLIDWLSMSEGRVKQVGLAHMAINLVVVTLYALNFALRWQGQAAEGTPFALSVVGVALLAVAGWLGAHMVFVHGAAVAPSGPKPLIERRRVQVPVQQERRRFSAGMPVGQF